MPACLACLWLSVWLSVRDLSADNVLVGITTQGGDDTHDQQQQAGVGGGSSWRVALDEQGRPLVRLSGLGMCERVHKQPARRGGFEHPACFRRALGGKPELR